MGVESLHCPACGAPVEVTAGVLVSRCGLCGSTLRVERQAAGKPVGALRSIQAETAVSRTGGEVGCPRKGRQFPTQTPDSQRTFQSCLPV